MCTTLCSGLIMKNSSISCWLLSAKLSNPVTKKPTIPTSRYTAPKASARICGQGRAPVLVLPAEAAFVFLQKVCPPPVLGGSAVRYPRSVAYQPISLVRVAHNRQAAGRAAGGTADRPTTGVRTPAVERFSAFWSACGRLRPADGDRADGEQVDRCRAEALEGVARVVDHGPAGGVQAGVDHDRQAGAPLEGGAPAEYAGFGCL